MKPLKTLSAIEVSQENVSFRGDTTYDTDLTNDQWHLLRRFLPAAKKRGRPRTALREVLNAILYLVKTGAQWRLLPKNFPPWQTVYHHFRQWSSNGLLARLNHRLRAKVRQAVGKHAQPTAASLDSQTVRASAHGGPRRLRCRQENQGPQAFPAGGHTGVAVGPQRGARRLPGMKRGSHPTGPRLGRLSGTTQTVGGRRFQRPGVRRLGADTTSHLDRGSRETSRRGAQIHPVAQTLGGVERTFGGLRHCRRLVRDHEQTAASAAGWIYLAMTRLMLRRLA